MNYIGPSISKSDQISDKTWTILWALLGLSLFVSKSGISIFGSILVIWSFFKTDWNSTKKENPWLLVIIMFFPIAVFVSVFSLDGSQAVLNVLKSWTWPLYVVPFALLFKDAKAFKIFGAALTLGLVVSCIKSSMIFYTEFQFQFASGVRVASFWDISRWAYFLACSTVILFGLLGDAKVWNSSSQLRRAILIGLFVLTISFQTLANSRGPWLAGIIGVTVLGISGKRYLKLLGGFFVIIAISLLAVPGILTRVQSSFSAKSENGVITSTDASNAGRLHMWKVNSEFLQEQIWFGTGFERAEAPLRAYIEKQSDEYKAKYIDPEFSFKDQHNSYLWVLTEMGLVFFLIFWGVVGWIMCRSIPTLFKTSNVFERISFGMLVAQLFMFIFYSSFSSYEMIWFFSPLLILTVSMRKTGISVFTNEVRG